VIVALVACGLGFPPPAEASYLTIQMGRAQYAQTVSQKACLSAVANGTDAAAAGTVSLPAIEAELAARGITPSTTVQLSFTGDTRRCVGQIQYASWSDLSQARDQYGWNAVSAGDWVGDYRTLSDADVIRHSCGTLSQFQAHGFNDAWGEFAFPNSQSDARTQADVTSCFAYFRLYSQVKTNALPIPKSYLAARTYSLTGGRCNDPTLPCSSSTVKALYQNPQAVIDLVNAMPANGWAIIQPYRFVTGSSTGWDCTSADWHAHWTTQPEAFCWNDFLQILNGLRTDLTQATPAQIATLTGRAAAIGH
jgi:hypothetical protein